MKIELTDKQTVLVVECLINAMSQFTFNANIINAEKKISDTAEILEIIRKASLDTVNKVSDAKTD